MRGGERGKVNREYTGCSNPTEYFHKTTQRVERNIVFGRIFAGAWNFFNVISGFLHPLPEIITWSMKMKHIMNDLKDHLFFNQ